MIETQRAANQGEKSISRVEVNYSEHPRNLKYLKKLKNRGKSQNEIFFEVIFEFFLMKFCAEFIIKNCKKGESRTHNLLLKSQRC